jgi:hypothetical protein
MITIYITQTQESELNEFVSSHLMKCFEWLEMVNGGEDLAFQEGCHFEPSAAFCGCDTCLQRETLSAAFKFLENRNILTLEYAGE